jgi:hypothetical protein
MFHAPFVCIHFRSVGSCHTGVVSTKYRSANERGQQLRGLVYGDGKMLPPHF